MNIKIGSYYKIIVNVNKILTYEGIITSEDENFISFIDKYDKTYSYNKNVVVSVEDLNKRESDNGEQI